MDLLDFEQPELYFEQEEPEAVGELLKVASSDYGSPKAAEALVAAEGLAPESLTVLVAVFRYHYYQHNLERARNAGLRAAQLVAERLRFDTAFEPTPTEFAQAFATDPGAARFFLQSLKGIGYLSLRLGEPAKASALLSTVANIDAADRLGCRMLLELITRNQLTQNQASATAPGVRSTAS
jgi:protein-disulfide isomerase-like protein with CxxC motif